MYERVVQLDNTPRVVLDSVNLVIRLIKKRVFVDKYHINPECNYPWEDPDSFESKYERELEAERAEEGQLAEAV